MQSGSVGKQFVSAAIMMLAEENKLSLDDSITRYFPDAPATWKPMLIKNLLSHTSGLSEYESGGRVGPNGPFYLRLDFTEDELIKKIYALPIEWAPCRELRRKRAHGKFITTSALAPIAGGNWAAQFCDNNRFIRQELLDQIVWAEVVRLLQDPVLIQQELDRRLAAARASDPTRKREQSLQRELSHIEKGIERLLTAYQEELLSLEQLRERMPMLRQRQQALRAELQAIADQANDRAAFLRLAETLTAFLTRLRSAAESLSVIERQKIVRLLVKEILVGEDTITIRHSIPIPSAPPQTGGSEALNGQNYLLCKGRGVSTAHEFPPFAVGERTDRPSPLSGGLRLCGRSQRDGGLRGEIQERKSLLEI
jgi:Beta-lactamase